MRVIVTEIEAIWVRNFAGSQFFFHLKPPRGCSNHSSCLVGEEARGLILSPRPFLYLNDEIGGQYPTDTDEGRGKTASADS
jgi:hypothetical protein